jgi:hypothetical protein
MDFLQFLLPSQASLEGYWKRVGDRFDGCALEVASTAGQLFGRLTHVPTPMAEVGWQIGDLKWQAIRKPTTSSWRVQDIRKHYDQRTKKVVHTDAREYWLTLGGTDSLRLHTAPLPFFPDQRWVRVDAQPSKARMSSS